MYAMTLERAGSPLQCLQMPDPLPRHGELLVRVEACGVCRTDLHVVDGELPLTVLPMTPGHECVGIVESLGPDVQGIAIGDRIGIPWLGSTCQTCAFCMSGRENLCDTPEFTGYTRPGGFASHLLARADYVIKLEAHDEPISTAPMLCAGLIGWRALHKAGPAARLGLYGFGASAHIIAQIATMRGQEVFAFTRPGDTAAQAFARSLGAAWAGGSDQAAPCMLDAAIIFAPVGALVPTALRAVAKGGRVVCAGIHMSDIPAMPYQWLWQEREVVSVANLTRQDAAEFFASPYRHRIVTRTRCYSLTAANEALDDLRAGRFEGAAVLIPQRMK